jgi:hypothetical protein
MADDIRDNWTEAPSSESAATPPARRVWGWDPDRGGGAYCRERVGSRSSARPASSTAPRRRRKSAKSRRLTRR